MHMYSDLEEGTTNEGMAGSGKVRLGMYKVFLSSKSFGHYTITMGFIWSFVHKTKWRLVG